MDKILFVNIYDHLEPDIFEPPLGLISLKSILDKNEFDSEIIDFQYLYVKGNFDYSPDLLTYVRNMESVILSKNSRIISFYSMCNNIHIILFVIKQLKEIDPNLIIGMGGPQATLAAQAIMEQFPFVDFIGLGEGEVSICNIVKALLKDNFDFPNSVRGLIYRHEEYIIDGGMPDLIHDLDTLPILEYGEFDIEGVKYLPIDVGRGCPYQCTFCSTNVFWKRKYRLKSPERLIDEVKYYKQKYRITNFSFMHDML